MKRIIYSLYIDIPSEQLDDQPAYRGDTISKSERTKIELAKNYDKLIQTKKRYANIVNADFAVFEYKDYLPYYTEMKKKYPQITDYNIINFYKIKLLYDLLDYDEILYLDFDVVPITNENFFEAWNLDEGIAIAHNNDHIRRNNKRKLDNRSPTAKHYNCSAMLIDRELPPSNHVYNTGIIGAKAHHLEQLDYFSQFESNIDLMDYLINTPDEGMFPENISAGFGHDNETLWSYKVEETSTPMQWLDEKWHYFFDNDCIFKETKFVHAINKNFDYIWKYCEKNNIQCL
jgi:hypothetical protein